MSAYFLLVLMYTTQCSTHLQYIDLMNKQNISECERQKEREGDKVRERDKARYRYRETEIKKAEREEQAIITFLYGNEYLMV